MWAASPCSSYHAFSCTMTTIFSRTVVQNKAFLPQVSDSQEFSHSKEKSHQYRSEWPKAAQNYRWAMGREMLEAVNITVSSKGWWRPTHRMASTELIPYGFLLEFSSDAPSSHLAWVLRTLEPILMGTWHLLPKVKRENEALGCFSLWLS